MSMGVIFKSSLVAVKKEIRNGLERNMQKALDFAKKKIQDKLSRKYGSGRVYFNISKRDEKGRLVFKHVHIASAPGEPPVEFTGALKRSIKTDVGKSRYFIEGKIYTNDKKAVTLEFGDVGMNIAKRPFFRNTVEENKQKILEILHRNIEYNKVLHDDFYVQ